jgi:hypothetical protein
MNDMIYAAGVIVLSIGGGIGSMVAIVAFCRWRQDDAPRTRGALESYYWVSIVISIAIAILYFVLTPFGPVLLPLFGRILLLIGLIATLVFLGYMAYIRFAPLASAMVATKRLHLDRALSLYYKSADKARINETLYTHLPSWPLRSMITQCFTELLELKRSSRIARSAGVPSSITDPIASEADAVAAALCFRAHRLGAAGRQNVPTDRLQRALKRQENTLGQILETVKQLRQYLAEATLGGTRRDLQREDEENLLRDLHSHARVLEEETDW